MTAMVRRNALTIVLAFLAAMAGMVVGGRLLAPRPHHGTELHTLLHRDIRSIVAELPSDEANVIRMRYGLDDDKPMTLDEISKIVHTTRQAVSRVESRAKLRLFAKAVSQDMQLYLTD